MTTYRTQVFYVALSPLGLAGNRWVVDHHCITCRQRVPADQLVTHAQHHEHDDHNAHENTHA